MTSGMEQTPNINLGFSAGQSVQSFKKVSSALLSVKWTCFNLDLQGHKLVAKLPFSCLKRKNKSCVLYLVSVALRYNHQFLSAFASGNNIIVSPDP